MEEESYIKFRYTYSIPHVCCWIILLITATPLKNHVPHVTPDDNYDWFMLKMNEDSFLGD